MSTEKGAVMSHVCDLNDDQYQGHMGGFVPLVWTLTLEHCGRSATTVARTYYYDNLTNVMITFDDGFSDESWAQTRLFRHSDDALKYAYTKMVLWFLSGGDE